MILNMLNPFLGFFLLGPYQSYQTAPAPVPVLPVLHGPILMVSRVMRTCEAGTQQNLHPCHDHQNLHNNRNNIS